MSLRAYFDIKKLRQNAEVTLWHRTATGISPITRQEAEREDWKLFGFCGVRIRYDENVGLPFVELDHFETRANDNPWRVILRSPAIAYYFIVESWTGDQAAGTYTDNQDPIQWTAVITRVGDLVNLQLKAMQTAPMPPNNALILLAIYSGIRAMDPKAFKDGMKYDKK